MALSVEEELVVREWAPLSHLFQKLPSKHQGLFSSDLKLTCIDAINELIVMGTNLGIIYCFNRHTHNLERLKCEVLHSAVTCIKIISTVDYMLACGNKDGNIHIFQLPKTPPESLPPSLRPKEKQVERYTVSEMHKGHITCLEWSKNGMKLFSGDASGHVVLTEIDFYMHLCKSSEILDEAYEVVQLNYLQQRLLVSTTYRSIICQRQDKWKVCQVGKKDRKVLGNYGGLIMQEGLGPSDLALYCARPGLRIWQADLSGSVGRTILFKETVKDAPEVFLLNPKPSNLPQQLTKDNNCANFGTLHQLGPGSGYLVTHDACTVYILSLKDLKLVGIVNNLRGILDLAVFKDEIFILESERSLIRISSSPEMHDNYIIDSAQQASNKFAGLRELTNKLQASTIITAAPTKSAFPQGIPAKSPVATAEEATENTTTHTTRDKYNQKDRTTFDSYRKQEIYNKIAEQDFDDVIQHTQPKHKKKTRTKTHRKPQSMSSSMCSYSSNTSNTSNSSDDNTLNAFRPTLMNISTVGLVPDVKSPDSLAQDINEKENLLAEILKFDSVKVDLNKLQPEENLDLENLEKIKPEIEDSRPEVDQVFASVSGPNTKPQPAEMKNIIPECKTLPNTWSVNKVNLKTPQEQQFAPLYAEFKQLKKDTKINNELELSDWEIV